MGSQKTRSKLIFFARRLSCHFIALFLVDLVLLCFVFFDRISLGSFAHTKRSGTLFSCAQLHDSLCDRFIVLVAAAAVVPLPPYLLFVSPSSSFSGLNI